MPCLLSKGYLVAAAGMWELVLVDSHSSMVGVIYFAFNVAPGLATFSVILLLAALFALGKI